MISRVAVSDAGGVPPDREGLRVGVVGPTGADDFATNIAHCLPELGVRAIALGPARLSVRNPRLSRPLRAARGAFEQIDRAYQRRLLARIEQENLDLVISIDASLLPETVREIKRRGVRVCLWFPDAVGTLGRQYMLLGDYDALFFKDPILVERLSHVLQLPVWYLPEACNPAWHYPPTSVPETPSVVVAGNVYGARIRLVNELLNRDIDVRIYGPPIPPWIHDPRITEHHAGRYISRQEKAAVYRGASAVLNALHPAEMNSVNCRLFEAAGCGAAVLCERREVLSDLFEEDKEVLAFSSFGELMEKIQFCLKDRAAARDIGDAAALRSHRDHSYAQRLSRLLEIAI
ncbi:CgeB family protein [Parafrankia sp. FMc2]|uniref:CgeB family protein n=1 Tax=Parafrankia sp. FMc2 TaxID=3233196 RepID=UPI0034D78FA3